MMQGLLAIWKPLCHLQFFLLLALYTFLGLTRSTSEMIPAYNDLAMHFCGYLAAGVSISLAWPGNAYWQRALFLFAYSIAIEIGQHFLPPRTFSVLDIVANAGGIILGLYIFFLLQKFSPHWLKPFLRTAL
jgi:VanZ family protein